MRSLLYVPADQPRMLAKARTRGADAVIVDLEDAVAVARKSDARDAASDFISSPPEGSGAIVSRINNTDELSLDLAAVLSPQLSAITLAKAENLVSLNIIDAAASAFEEKAGLEPGTIMVYCLIETAAGVRNAYALASHPRTDRLGLGEADLGADLGIPHDAPDDVWWPIRSRIVVDSAAAGIQSPIAPVSTDFEDLARLATSTTALATNGFGARPAIHPSQISPINQAFTPTEHALAKASDVIKRHTQSLKDGSAVVLDADGRMVDEAVIKQARRVIEAARENIR